MNTKNIAIAIVGITSFLMIALVVLAFVVIIYAQNVKDDDQQQTGTVVESQQPPVENNDDSEWQLLIYDQTQLLVLTQDGFQNPIPLPEAAHNIYIQRNLLASPDGRYFVFPRPLEGQTVEGNPLSELWIANLQNGACCTVVQNPLPHEPDVLLAGKFNADSTQFIYSFSRVYNQVNSPDDMMAKAAIFDAATGQIVSLLPEYREIAYEIGEWRENDDILFFPTCVGCGGAIDGYYHSWNADTGALVENAQYFNLLGDTLTGTGESLRLIRDDAYPLAPEMGMIPPANVIHYHPTNMEGDGTLVYHDANDITLGSLFWVMDGAAYVIYDWEGGNHKLVYRDGLVEELMFREDEHILTGTPNGWLAYTQSSNILTHYTLLNGVQLEEAISVNDNVAIVHKPALGNVAAPMQPVIR